MVDVGCSYFDEENSIVALDKGEVPVTKVIKRFCGRDVPVDESDQFKDFPEDCGASAVGRGRQGIG